MNRSFRAPEKGMPAPAKQRQQQMLGSFRNSLMKEKEEELGLFLEMKKREKERNNLLLQNREDEFDPSLGSRTGSSPIFNMPSAIPARKTVADEFLNSENDKNDYDWLLTPPGTPLFPSLEKESHKTVMNQIEAPKARPMALKSRLSSTQPEATGRHNFVSRQQAPSPGLNTSYAGPRRPSSSGGPTSRPTLGPSSRPSNLVSKSTMPSKSTPSSTSRSSRSSTPTSRASPSLTKPTPPARSSTPTPRSTPRSSTPTSRPSPSLPANKPVSRAPTPTRRPTPMLKSPTNTTRNAPPPPPASSPNARPRPWNPQEMPGYSLDAPPNLRTSLSDRPISGTRGRPGASSIRSSSVEPVPNGRPRRQSCSPSRGRLPNGMNRSSGNSVPVSTLNRAYAKANDNTNPGSYGNKMVERVINMRKLVPPKQDDKHSTYSNLSGKSSSPDSLGFGRSLSKKSLDMAMRHMDISRRVPSNLRSSMANVPALTMYSVRSAPTRSRTISVSDSPLATSSNASSEVSVNNNALCLDPNIDDDINSEKGGLSSPASIHGR